MFKKILLTMACLMCWGASVAYAVGTTTVTTTKVAGQEVYETKIAWVADAAAATVPNSTTPSIDGWVLFVSVNQGDVTTCANDMDITVTDSTGVDVLGGVFVDLQAATTDSEQAAPAIGSAYGARYVIGSLTAIIANCGTNSATGDLYIYWVR